MQAKKNHPFSSLYFSKKLEEMLVILVKTSLVGRLVGLMVERKKKKTMKSRYFSELDWKLYLTRFDASTLFTAKKWRQANAEIENTVMRRQQNLVTPNL